MLNRREFARNAALTAAAAALGRVSAALNSATPDITIEIAPYLLEASPKHRIRTVAYNGQVPGPLLRMKQGKEVLVEVRNHSNDEEVVHWHGLFLPSDVDGAMEEGTPMIAPGATARYRFTPDPAGFRWYHTHTFAGKNLRKAQYGGQHGFLIIEGAHGDSGAYDQEVFLALHDWNGYMMGSDDGAMNPIYDISTINGKMLGYGEPLRVKQGQRVLMHVLNSSPTEVHWLTLPGHAFHVIALDGNAVPTPETVPALRLAPAERISAIVTMNTPGIWTLGETRANFQKAGMGIRIEYAGARADITRDTKSLAVTAQKWDYSAFAAKGEAIESGAEVERIPLAFESKFEGHGSPERWTINGQSYPKTEEPILHAGKRYRLVMKNLSADDHPIHLHRHTFEVRRVDGSAEMHGLHKDVLLVPAKSTAEVEFVAANPGRTLFHCHQQDHMDRGFMMVFRYA